MPGDLSGIFHCNPHETDPEYSMDNRTAFWLALIIVCIFAADHFYFHWGLAVFIGQQIARVSEWLAFWHKF